MSLPGFAHSFVLPSFLVYSSHTTVRELFESVRLGSQAFKGAAVFNADIGAWNTASMTTIANVSPHCHRLCLRSLCFMLASVLHSFLENCMCT